MKKLQDPPIGPVNCRGSVRYILAFSILFATCLFSQNQSVLVLDDFSQFPENPFGKPTGTFPDTLGSFSVIRIVPGDQAFDGMGKSLAIDYDITPTNGYTGYYSLLSGLDLSRYHYLSFWMKGEVGREYMQVQLKSESSQASVAVWNYMPCGPSSAWRKVIIPFDAFYNLESRNEITEIVFVFENYQATVNGSPLRSTVYIDDIICGTFFTGSLQIDAFHDRVKTNALGANIGDFSETGEDSLYWSEIVCPQGSLNCSCYLALHYDNTKNSEYGGTTLIFGGADTGWKEVYRSLKRYSVLTIGLGGSTLPESPGNVKLEFSSKDKNYSHVFKEITTDFETRMIPLQDFRYLGEPLDSAEVGKFSLVFEKNMQDSPKGVLNVDNVALYSIDGLRNRGRKPDSEIRWLLDGSPEIRGATILQESTLQIDPSVENDLLESIRVEFRDGVYSPWQNGQRDYANESGLFTLETQGFSFEEGGVVDLKATLQNFNGEEAESVPIHLRTPGFDLSLSSLFKNCIDAFRLSRLENGLYSRVLHLDGTPAESISISATGAGLISLCISDAMGWHQGTVDSVVATLKALLGMRSEYKLQRSANGFYAELYNIESGRPHQNSRYSSIHTSELLAGVLFCQSYFRTDLAIANLTRQLWKSIAWGSMVADPTTNLLYSEFNELGIGNDATKMYPSLMMLLPTWLGMNSGDEQATYLKSLWSHFYENPEALPQQEYHGLKLLTDSQYRFVSSSRLQKLYFLSKPVNSSSVYSIYFDNAMEAEKAWWRDEGTAEHYEWGMGTGEDLGTGDFVENAVNSNDSLIITPHAIAGFLPGHPELANNLVEIIEDGKAVSRIQPGSTVNVIVRYSLKDHLWRARQIYLADFAHMLFGLATLAENVGAEFFREHSDFNFVNLNANAPSITTTTLQQGRVNEFFSDTLHAIGGTEPFNWQILNDSLPDSLSINASTGIISGYPKVPGDFDLFTVVQDASTPSFSDTSIIRLHIRYEQLNIIGAQPDTIELGMRFADTLFVTGGKEPFAWTVSPHPSFDSLRIEAVAKYAIISGIARAPGNAEFQVKVSDSQAPPDSAALTIHLYTELSNGVSHSQSGGLPTEFRLLKNYPNPFNSTTLVEYHLAVPGHVKLYVFDQLGRRIRQLADTNQPAGIYRVAWDGRDDDGNTVGSGVFVLRLSVGQYRLSQKFLLIK